MYDQINSPTLYWNSNSILCMSGYVILDTPREKRLNFANNGYLYQMLHSTVTDPDLHYFPITLLGSPDKSELICFTPKQDNLLISKYSRLKGNTTLTGTVLQSKELNKQWILTKCWSESVENQLSYRQLNILALVEWVPPFWIFNEVS